MKLKFDQVKEPSKVNFSFKSLIGAKNETKIIQDKRIAKS